jgi:hypothetical protein
LPKEDVLQVLRILKRCKVEEIHAYGRDKLGKKRPHILVDETRIHDALVVLSRKGLVKRNEDGTWELCPATHDETPTV